MLKDTELEYLFSADYLGWLDTAGTGLFIVFNDTEHFGQFERTGFMRGPRQRQFVIKYSRLLEFSR